MNVFQKSFIPSVGVYTKASPTVFVCFQRKMNILLGAFCFCFLNLNCAGLAHF